MVIGYLLLIFVVCCHILSKESLNIHCPKACQYKSTRISRADSLSPVVQRMVSLAMHGLSQKFVESCSTHRIKFAIIFCGKKCETLKCKIFIHNFEQTNSIVIGIQFI